MNIFEAFKAIKEGKMVILSQPTYLRIFRFNKELKCVEIKHSFKGEWECFYKYGNGEIIRILKDEFEAIEKYFGRIWGGY